MKISNGKQKLVFISMLVSLRFALMLAYASPAYADITNPVIGIFGSGDPGNAAATILASIWKALVVMGGIAFILYFAWGALSWLSSGGDKAKVEEAREKISNAVIGLILIAASVAITTTIGVLFNIDFLRDLTFEFPEAL